MQYEPELIQTGHNSGTPIRVVLVGCGVIFIIGFVIALLAGRLLWSWMGPSRTVKVHLQAINQGDYSLAYGYFCDDFRKVNSLRDFQVELHPFFSLLPYRSTVLNYVTVSGEYASVEGTITARDGSLFPIHYELDKEEGKWRIRTYQWTFPGERIAI